MINVVLYHPEIPQNTGNIMRTCAGTDTNLHLIKPLGFSLDEKAVRRSGANYINETNYFLYESFEEFKEKNPGKYFFLTRYGKKTPKEFDFKNINEDIYLIFGSESSGMPKELLQDHLETCIRLPMNDKIRALNLSNCVAILVYEVLGNRGYENLLKEEPFKTNYLDN